MSRYAPDGFDFRPKPIGGDAPIPASITDGSHDVVLLLSADYAVPVRRALDESGSPSKLLVQWRARWPSGLERWHEVYRLADGVLFSDPIYHARLGRPPRTHLAQPAYDPATFHQNAGRAGDGPSVLLLRTALAERRRTYDLLLKKIAFDQRWDVRIVDTAGENAVIDPAAWAALATSATVLLYDPNCDEATQRALEAAACGGRPVAVADRIADNNTPMSRRRMALDYYETWDALDGFLGSADPCTSSLSAELDGWSWVERADDYAAAIRAVVDIDATAPTKNIVDLRDQVTVFVTTVGAPSYPACMEHLRFQDSQFHLHEIRNVAPMSAAFQQMVDLCETPFYIQVDEDMLLYPHAVRRLHELILEEGGDAALYAAPLFDPHLDRTIEAVKIFDTSIGKRYPFVDIANCDVERNDRMEANGYRVAKPPKEHRGWYAIDLALGLHGPHWTSRSIYERYATLERLHVENARVRWVEEHAHKFLSYFLDEPSERNYFALMGIVAGALSANDGYHREKDFRTYDRYLHRDLLETFYGRLTAREPGAPPSDDEKTREK